jgi:CopG family nickel-responsive transcriptional regulator
MSDIVRFSVSVEDGLLDKFDRFCKEERFATRSEAVRQLIRDTLTRRAWVGQSHGTIMGSCCRNETVG